MNDQPAAPTAAAPVGALAGRVRRRFPDLEVLPLFVSLSGEVDVLEAEEVRG